MQLEHEAGVVVEAAAERGGETDARDIDAARGEEAGAALEQVERGIERDPRLAGERAQRGGGLVRIAADGEEIARSARASPAAARSGAERRLFEEAIGDLADRAAADRGDAGDRQQIGDQRMRRLRVGAGERRQHALIFGPRACAAPIVSRSRSCASEVLRLKSFTSRRFHAGARSSAAISAENSADIADADVGLRQAVMRRRLEAEREHLGIGGGGVGAAEGFDAGLEEFARRRRRDGGRPGRGSRSRALPASGEAR